MTFKSVVQKLTTTAATLYTTPNDTSSIIFSGVISNTSSVEEVTSSAKEAVTVSLYLTNGSTNVYLLAETEIQYGSSVTLPKILVKPGYSIVGIAVGDASNNAVDITLSILEVTSTDA